MRACVRACVCVCVCAHVVKRAQPWHVTQKREIKADTSSPPPAFLSPPCFFFFLFLFFLFLFLFFLFLFLFFFFFFFFFCLSACLPVCLPACLSVCRSLPRFFFLPIVSLFCLLLLQKSAARRASSLHGARAGTLTAVGEGGVAENGQPPLKRASTGNKAN